MPRPSFLVRARSVAIGRGIAGGASNLQIDQSLKVLVHNDVDVASRRWWDCVTHMEVRNWSRVMATCMAFHSLAMDQTAWHRVQSLLETDYSNRCIDQVSKHFRLHLLFLSIKDEQTKKVWRSGISVSLFPAWTGFHLFHRCFYSLVTPDLPKLLALDLRPAELAFFRIKAVTIIYDENSALCMERAWQGWSHYSHSALK